MLLYSSLVLLYAIREGESIGWRDSVELIFHGFSPDERNLGFARFFAGLDDVSSRLLCDAVWLPQALKWQPRSVLWAGWVKSDSWWLGCVLKSVTTFFAFGGASSHDIQGGVFDRNSPSYLNDVWKACINNLPYRVLNESWWPAELSTEEEMQEGRRNLEIAGY